MPDYSIYPIAALVVGYILGAIPFAVFVAKRYGVDILRTGSGNPGATNVKRSCGKKAGNTVFTLDALKGFVATFWPILVPAVYKMLNDGQEVSATGHEMLVLAQLAGFAGAVVGHCFSIFLKFKGGKGVSVTMGALLGAMPVAVLTGALVWLATFFVTRYVSLASLLFGVSLPVSAYFFHDGTGTHFWFSLIIMIFILAMHHSNIKRLLKGEENRFAKKQ